MHHEVKIEFDLGFSQNSSVLVYGHSPFIELKISLILTIFCYF